MSRLCFVKFQQSKLKLPAPQPADLEMGFSINHFRAGAVIFPTPLRGYKMRHTKRIGFIIALPMSLVAGCANSKPKPPPPVPISGKVVFADGRPVAKMVISLHPQDEQNASTRPSGALDNNGNYKMDAIPGRYKVTLAPIPATAGSAAAADDLPVPKKGDLKKLPDPMSRYRNATESPLELTVPASGGEMPKLTVN
jgi:hypothetical protein